MINENDKVILEKDGILKVIVVKRDETVHFEKLKFSSNGLIGSKFEDRFTVEENDLIILENKNLYDEYEKIKLQECGTDESNRDNRSLISCTHNQKINSKQLSEFKNQGKSGNDIIDILIENSKSFDKKTKFAQEKYLKKKKKQYLPIVSVHKISIRKLCKLYESKSKLKILNLRFDSVCQIMSMANVHYDTKALIVETVNGLITGAALERGAKIVNFYHGSAAVLPEQFSNWSELNDRVFNLPLSQLIPLARHSHLVGHFTSQKATDNESGEKPMKKPKIDEKELEKIREERDKRREAACNYLLQSPVDCVIIATRFNPVKLTKECLSLLRSSKPFVVYCQFLQPLVEVYDSLITTKSVSNMKITEGHLSNIQVMVDRTHPMMTTSGTGGYILSGLKVLD